MIDLRPSAQPTLRVAALLAGCITQLAVPLRAQPASDSLIRRPVQFTSGAVTIAATLVKRADVQSAAAVVIVHGSGPSARDNPWTSAYADALARRGIVVLHPDKRGSGESTGDWRVSSVPDLANDVRAGVALLRTVPGVDSMAVGLIGFSQGGYVTAVVAAEDQHVAFTAVVSGGVATLREQIVDELILEAERRGQSMTPTEVETVQSRYTSLFEFARTRNGWTSYMREVQASQAAGGPLAYALRTMPVDSSHWVIGYIAHMGNFDPVPYWSRVRTPTVFLYGGKDTQVRVDRSVARLRALPSSTNFIITTLGGNGHALFREDITAFLVEWMQRRGQDQ